MSPTPSLRVVIADDIPMDRHLLRFFLEEEGFQVVGESSDPAGAAQLVDRHRPDAIVLHESLTVGSGAEFIPFVRRTSPATRIVLLSRYTGETPRVPALHAADAYLEEGVGLKELAPTLRRLSRSPLVAVGGPETPELLSVANSNGKSSKRAPRRPFAHVQFIAAASIVIIAISVMRGPLERLLSNGQLPVRGIGQQTQADRHMRSAYARLQDLLEDMRTGSARAIADDARALVAARAAALAAGNDVSNLDALIAASVPSLLPHAPRAAATVVKQVLGPVIEGAGATPSPTASVTGGEDEVAPSPSAVEEPPPPPTESSSPAPSQEPSPSPSETPGSEPCPTPTETPEPSPSPSESLGPDPSPSPTEPCPTPTGTPTPEPSPSPDSPSPEASALVPSVAPTDTPTTPEPSPSPSDLAG